jgi:type I restriction enzyme M protein
MSSTIVQKIWNFCNTLRDDGVSYGDYLEQLTYLLFLKMADEYSKPPHKRTDINIPTDLNWESLTEKSGDELERHYNKILRSLGKEKGILGQIFIKSQNKIQDPAKLYKLIQLIDAENWVGMGVKDKGDIYEGILKKNAEDTKSGAGQYFTPRNVIDMCVYMMNPKFDEYMIDTACGSCDYRVEKSHLLESVHRCKSHTFESFSSARGLRRAIQVMALLSLLE